MFARLLLQEPPLTLNLTTEMWPHWFHCAVQKYGAVFVIFDLAKSDYMLIDFIQLHHLWLRLFLLHSPLTHCLTTCNNVNVYRTLALYEKLHINIHWIDARHDESAAAEMGAGRRPWRLVCKLQSGRKGKSNNRFWEPGWILEGTRMFCWGGFKYQWHQRFSPLRVNGINIS